MLIKTFCKKRQGSTIIFLMKFIFLAEKMMKVENVYIFFYRKKCLQTQKTEEIVKSIHLSFRAGNLKVIL